MALALRARLGSSLLAAVLAPALRWHLVQQVAAECTATTDGASKLPENLVHLVWRHIADNLWRAEAGAVMSMGLRHPHPHRMRAAVGL